MVCRISFLKVFPCCFIRDAMFGSKDPTCPFFAFFSLADILDIASPDGIVVSHQHSQVNCVSSVYGIKDGTSFCYFTYILHISRWSKKLGFPMDHTY